MVSLHIFTHAKNSRNVVYESLQRSFYSNMVRFKAVFVEHNFPHIEDIITI